MKKLVAILSGAMLALVVFAAPVSASPGSCAAWQNYVDNAPAPIAAYIIRSFNASGICHLH